MRGMTLETIDSVRQMPGRSALLFITERCPVGCGHCSVDSRPDSPSIEDFDLFAELLKGLRHRPGLELVGISGGEPFVEKRGLQMAVNAFSEQGLATVVYTSGIWARGAHHIPAWIKETLAKIDTVFLSSDTFHEESVTDADLKRAILAIVDAGCGLILQTLDDPEMVTRSRSLLRGALGEDWETQCELSLVPPLPYGRAEGLFQVQKRHNAETFGRCGSPSAPVVRFDGTITACCNEAVIMGQGSDRLRTRVTTASELTTTLDNNRADPLLRGIRRLGLGKLLAHPDFNQFKDKRYPGACDLCWRLQDQTPSVGSPQDRLLTALSIL